MAKIIDFAEKLKKGPSKSKKKSAPDSTTLKLWYLSQEFDKLVTQGILKQNLKPEELAAMIAHRLGALIKCSENQAELVAFCTTVIERVNKDKPVKTKGKGA